MLIQKNIFLKNCTTFKIGGPARYFVAVKNIDKAKEAVSFAKNKKLPIFILGGGSNILVSDQGFNGLVIKISLTDFVADNDEITAGAGLNLNLLIQKCWENNLIGLKKMFGIYGTLGGAIRGNAGAFGSEIADFVEEVVFCDEKNEIKIFNQEQCKFSYRDSIFKEKPDWIVLSAKLKLKIGNPELEKKMAKDLWQKRAISQPKEPSAGCIFKNIKSDDFDIFLSANHNLNLPKDFLANKSIPAAWLIEQTGFKGSQIGDAQVFEKHVNFIINKNQATAQDVVALINLIKNKVKEKFKIDLQEEIQYVGF